MIILPAQPHSDLNWTNQIKEAESSSQKIIWEFDLGLDAPYFPLEDELRFQTLTMALSKFSKEIWPLFQEKTEAAILYRGPADFTPFFSWSERQEGNFETWKEDRPNGDEAHLRRLFCAEAFIAYFQMLAHRLPDELTLILQLDAGTSGTLAERLHLLSPERFDHFQLEIKGLPDDSHASLGICFPEEGECDRNVLQRLDTVIEQIKTPFKAIPEALLTERWDGIDYLYVLSDAVSSRGKRKLMGFCAAGGIVILDGPSLGLPSEISLEEGLCLLPATKNS